MSRLATQDAIAVNRSLLLLSRDGQSSLWQKYSGVTCGCITRSHVLHAPTKTTHQHWELRRLTSEWGQSF